MQIASTEQLSDGISALQHGVDALLSVDFGELPYEEIREAIEEVERQARRLDAVKVAITDGVARSRVHDYDGHGLAQKMIANVAKISSRESSARARCARALSDMPVVKESFEAGEIGTEQVRVLALAHANPRVRDQLVANQDKMLQRADDLSFKGFDRRVKDWVRLADEDGTADRNIAIHNNRVFMMEQEYDGGWVLKGRLGCHMGAMAKDIFDHFVDLENQADWDKARELHGEDACENLLARTFDQRRADALYKMCEQAASTPPDAKAHKIVTNIVIDSETLERMIKTLAGEQVEADDPERDDFQCRTMDGYTLEPRETVAKVLDGEFRRAIIDATGSVTDVSHTQRMFRGLTRHAGMLQHTECTWQGCEVPVRYCQADHTYEHSKGGQTNLDNIGPACPRHNNLKNKGYRLWRDPKGRWRTYRPDGSEIT